MLSNNEASVQSVRLFEKLIDFGVLRQLLAFVDKAMIGCHKEVAGRYISRQALDEVKNLLNCFFARVEHLIFRNGCVSTTIYLIMVDVNH
ncbi:hypothetical protein SDC9_172724 [bioreactor metagenome]|uniref:Uncharacterized protein n=1 Tax=bioreactor metagenome TaxID=1076179 RepID=A0A645GGL4_9ZZZZ